MATKDYSFTFNCDFAMSRKIINLASEFGGSYSKALRAIVERFDPATLKPAEKPADVALPPMVRPEKPKEVELMAIPADGDYSDWRSDIHETVDKCLDDIKEHAEEEDDDSDEFLIVQVIAEVSTEMVHKAETEIKFK